MRFSVVVLTLSAAFSTAFAAMIARQSIPNCAVPCMINADFGNCASTDDSCLCHSQAFINSTTTCIQSSCTGSDLTNAEAASQQLCAAVGVTLTSASATATATSSSKDTSTATSSAKATSTATTSPSSNAASSNSINVFTGAAAFVILAASL
ncbi:hypothetical protein DFH29DRAFT_936956 [Suillus ampliporus]|nr:hypothetical protein DFH29DRAFT_936956 [Suillus ampliporus]